MKLDKKSDVLLNVVLPLLIGLLIYWSGRLGIVPSWIINYMPDGFWAYAFISCMLVIWDRRIQIFWVVLVFLISVFFEILQYRHMIPGTGDVMDVLIYFIFFGIALKLNRFFKILK
jgi:hypothetical protein